MRAGKAKILEAAAEENQQLRETVAALRDDDGVLTTKDAMARLLEPARSARKLSAGASPGGDEEATMTAVDARRVLLASTGGLERHR